MVPIEEEGREEMSERENPCAEERPFAVQVMESEIARLEGEKNVLEIQLMALRLALDKATKPQPRNCSFGESRG